MRSLPLSLSERAWLWWAAAAVLAVVTTSVVLGATGDADAARRRWGTTRAVVVAVAPIAAGEAVPADAVTLQELPEALAPDDALTELPVGRVALAPVVAGEVLVSVRLAPDGLSGPAALVPAGWRAVAVPGGPASPPLEVGDTVDLLATFVAEGTGEPPTFPVAERAVVVAVDDTGPVTLAVPAADAPRVAFAVSSGVVTLALRGAE